MLEKTNSSNNFANGEPINWPLCDRCDGLMDVVKSDEPKIAKFICTKDGFTLTFPSCREGHRYCAYNMLHPIKINKEVIF